MMNRSSFTPPDPYVPSSSMIMSFANGQTTTQPQHQQSQHQHQQQQLQVLEYFDPPQYQHHQTPYSFDPQQPPLLLPTNYAGGGGGGGRIGLNLGHRTYFSSADALTIDRLLCARAHQQQQGQQPPRCQAEGCKADLSGAKHYHRRHKVCEFHSKAPLVVAAGLHQRFCQQCSRFHVLGEFDESKRSCRKRLADHNRRRRKLQNPSSSTTTTNNSTEESMMARQTTATSTEYTTASRSTAAATAISTAISSDHNSGGFDQGGQVNQKSIKAAVALSSSEQPAPAAPALLSLGVDNQSQLYQYQQQQQQHFSSTSTPRSSFFYHQSLFGSSSNETSQSTEGTNYDHHHQRHQSNDQQQQQLLHLGQAMFQVDFM